MRAFHRSRTASAELGQRAGVISLRLSLFAASFVFAGAACATHTSIPIIAADKPAYETGEVIHLKGRVDYEGKPAAQVLVEVRLRGVQSEHVLVSHRVRSGTDGTFALEFALPRAAAGDYLLEAVSHCSDEHRHLCTGRRASIPLSIRAGSPR